MANFKKQLKGVQREIRKRNVVYFVGKNKRKLDKEQHISVALFAHKYPRHSGKRMKWELSPSYMKDVQVLKNLGLLGVAAAAGAYVTREV